MPSITWMPNEDAGYASDGFKYLLNGEFGIGEPPFWEPCFVGTDDHMKPIPSRFMPDGWMTKKRAKTACEKHNADRLARKDETKEPSDVLG